ALVASPRALCREHLALAAVTLRPPPIDQLAPLRVRVPDTVEPPLAVQEHVGVAVGVRPSGPADPERDEGVAVEVGEELAELEQLDLHVHADLLELCLDDLELLNVSRLVPALDGEAEPEIGRAHV